MKENQIPENIFCSGNSPIVCLTLRKKDKNIFTHIFAIKDEDFIKNQSKREAEYPKKYGSFFDKHPGKFYFRTFNIHTLDEFLDSTVENVEVYERLLFQTVPKSDIMETDEQMMTEYIGAKISLTSLDMHTTHFCIDFDDYKIRNKYNYSISYTKSMVWKNNILKENLVYVDDGKPLGGELKFIENPFEIKSIVISEYDASKNNEEKCISIDKAKETQVEYCISEPVNVDSFDELLMI